MMAIKRYNDVRGCTINPHHAGYAPGGSSQGEGALISYEGSRIGLGTDIEDCISVAAAWSGITSLRMTTWKFPLDGDVFCDTGFEGVQYVASLKAKSVGDLRCFHEANFSVKPWFHDYHLIPLPWRKGVKISEKPRAGLLRMDGMLPLAPAQDRASTAAVDLLKKCGCKIVDFMTPVPAREYYTTVFKLYGAAGYEGAT